MAPTGLTAFRFAHFSIAISRSMGTVVVTVHGDLEVRAARHLGGLLADIIDGLGNLGVVVDLHDTSAVAAGGASMLATSADLASKRGASLSSHNPPDVRRAALCPGLLQPDLPVGRVQQPAVAACC